MDLTPVVERLRGQCPTLRLVGSSAELDTALDVALALPAAFCVPLSESARSNPMTLLHEVTQRFGVLLVVSNRRDASGAAALVDLNALRLAVRTALIGWVPNPTEGEPVMYSGGALMRLDADSRLWWTEEYELKTYWKV